MSQSYADGAYFITETPVVLGEMNYANQIRITPVHFSPTYTHLMSYNLTMTIMYGMVLLFFTSKSSITINILSLFHCMWYQVKLIYLIIVNKGGVKFHGLHALMHSG